MLLKDPARSSSVPVVPAALLAALIVAPLPAQQAPPFAEQWALAADRGALLATLLPGTSDWFFHRCRERLDANDFAAVDAALSEWRTAHPGDEARQTLIENRRMLLDAARDREATFAWLQQRLGLKFDHTRVDPSVPLDLPTSFDPATIARDVLVERAIAKYPGSFAGFENSALPWLLEREYADEQLEPLLRKVADGKRADLPQVPALVVRHLAATKGTFSTSPVSDQLLLEHLDECVRRMPAMLQDHDFVTAYVRRISAGPDVALATDRASRGQHLDRLWAFAQRLGPNENDLKAHVLALQLSLDLERGTVDKARFLAWLALPRRSATFANAELVRQAPVDALVVGGTPPTGIVPSLADDDLARACFEQLLVADDDTAAYAPYVDAAWLQRTRAEVQLLDGRGDARQWQTILGDERAREIERRVELRFAATVPIEFATNDRVVLDLDTKNVASLLVRVHAIDTLRWYREKLAPVPIDLDLDGMVAAHERTIAIAEPPIRRVRHRLDLPECDAPGTYIVECIGNGLRSRVLLQKGALHCVHLVAADGHRFRVYDEAGARVPDAVISFGGRDFTADADTDGDIRLPFTSEPGDKQFIVWQGDRAALAWFEQDAGEPTFSCGFFVDRESLIAGATAKLLLRPRLTIAGVEIPATRLRDVQLKIVATTIDGVTTTEVVRDVGLVADREYVHELQVPERLRSLTALVAGLVPREDGATKIVSDSFDVEVNSADDSIATFADLPMRTTGGLVLEQRGKNGEPRGNRAVAFDVRIDGFTDAVEATLRTDERGHIRIGSVSDRDRVSFFADGAWQLFAPHERGRFPAVVHGVAGETLRVAYPAAARPPTRADVTFSSASHDLFDRVSFRDGFLELRDLPRGDHELWLHRFGVTIDVRVTRGVRDDTWIVGARALRAGPAAPLGLGQLEVRGGELLVPLHNASPRTRVHVVATRYEPPFSLADAMKVPREALEVFARPASTSRVTSAVPIPDEARYVLERRLLPKFPGNMLPRPSLLVHRLDLELTESDGLSATGGRKPGGGKYGSRFGRGKGGPGGPSTGGPSGPEDANLDWLPRPSMLLANLVPGADGVVRVPLADLGDGQHVHVVALDGDQLLAESLVRDETPLVPRPRHLQQALDPALELVETERLEAVVAGATVEVGDPRRGKTAVVDSLARVRAMFSSFAPDEPRRSAFGTFVDEFSFVLDWPRFDDAKKRASYSEHACHELHFFMWHKDRAFFDAVARPAIESKRVKRFVDHWLLGDDLRPFAEPLAYQRLNFVERAMLAKRLDGAWRDAIARDLREAITARPKDAAAAQRRFDVALAVGDLLAAAAERSEAAPQLRDRDAPPRLHPLGATRRYIEHDWWRRRPDQSGPFEVKANRFWLEWATAPADRPFVPTTLLAVGDTLLERTMALAVVDLPFPSPAHELRGEENARTLVAASPLLLVQRRIAAIESRPEPSTSRAPLLLGQSYLRLDDRHVVVDGEKRDRLVTGELVAGVPYACQVVVTNPTAEERAAHLLLQIPAGAIPLRKGFWTTSRTLELGPWSTTSFEYAFYFPAVGDFVHWPVHASENGVPVGAATARTLPVVTTPTVTDPTSWDDVSQRATNDEVLAYVGTHDAAQTDFTKIAWRAKDPGFFTAIVGKLRARLAYDHTLWSYGILHRDDATAREFVANSDGFVAQCGPVLVSPLVTIDPVERRTYQHLEFDPLVRARVHRFGPDDVADGAVGQQFGELLEVLGWQPRLSSEDWLAVTYYHLLQDRIADGLASFAKVDRAQIAERFQYDYLAAFAAFFTRDTAKARSLAEPHREHPVDHWRQRFVEVLAQVDEAEGKLRPTIPGTPLDPNSARVPQAPALEADVSGSTVTIRAQNVASCEIRYHVLDVEFAFSSRPFASRGNESAAFVQPALRETKEVPSGGVLAFEVPARFADRNTLVEVRGAGIVRTATRFANALAVRFVEPWGQVVVTDPTNGAPVPQAYVKVFARGDDQEARFHKDGYTDLRGRFDYVSVSEFAADAKSYAVLVLDDRRGAVIREVAPPAK